MTADRLHQVPALIPLGELSALVTESLKSGSLPLRGSRRSGVMRQCLGTDPRCLYSYRTSALRSLRLRVLASHLGRPGTPRLVGLRSKASLVPYSMSRVFYLRVDPLSTIFHKLSKKTPRPPEIGATRHCNGPAKTFSRELRWRF